ncbi:flagellar biosynthesis protein FlgL [Erythrobacter sp.]|uniref:flagellin N-terminal helical domain-containing protein n=1 Tax=Erythrobacter sp. TaxID=1042 RepID=UPI001425CC04|nr:flagellar biosynthesis protein FlgL [Erythrobacter sp.]QIQ87144.1 MAG: flagellar biosynthesis protein FlgL [Erythrobacter sp.]
MSFVSNSTGAFFQRSLGQMGSLRASLEKLQSQIATGERISRGSEDPAAAARLRALERRERLAAVEEDNAIKLSQDLTSGSMQLAGVTAILQRARELALQAANDTTGPDGRAIIAQELAQMEEELFTRANGVTLTGEPLFAGTAGGPAFTRDAAGNVAYAGNTEEGVVTIAPGTEIARGLDGRQVFEFDLAGAPTSTFAVLGDLADAMAGGAPDPAAAARAAVAGLDAALDATTRGQTVLGTRLAWVETVRDNQVEQEILRAEQASEAGDTDLGEAIARLQQTLTALEASQESFTRVSSLTLFNAL